MPPQRGNQDERTKEIFVLDTMQTGDCLFEVIEDDGRFYVQATDKHGNSGRTAVFPHVSVNAYSDWEDVIAECQVAESNITNREPPCFMTLAKEERESAL